MNSLGIIGPKRLNDARIVPMVDYTARVMGKLLGRGQNRNVVLYWLEFPWHFRASWAPDLHGHLPRKAHAAVTASSPIFPPVAPSRF